MLPLAEPLNPALQMALQMLLPQLQGHHGQMALQMLLPQLQGHHGSPAPLAHPADQLAHPAAQPELLWPWQITLFGEKTRAQLKTKGPVVRFEKRLTTYCLLTYQDGIRHRKLHKKPRHSEVPNFRAGSRLALALVQVIILTRNADFETTAESFLWLGDPSIYYTQTNWGFLQEPSIYYLGLPLQPIREALRPALLGP